VLGMSSPLVWTLPQRLAAGCVYHSCPGASVFALRGQENPTKGFHPRGLAIVALRIFSGLWSVLPAWWTHRGEGRSQEGPRTHPHESGWRAEHPSLGAGQKIRGKESSSELADNQGSPAATRVIGRHTEVRVLLRAILPLALLVAVTSPVTPEVLPTDVRDGCVSGIIPAYVENGEADLFVVPVDFRFVLTDVQVSTSPDVATQVVDDFGTLRWMWVGTQEPRSWRTGIVFGPGRTVRLRFPLYPYDRSYTICWSGYMKASDGTTSVSGKDQVGASLKIGPNPTKEGATLWFRLEREGPVKLAIYDAQGRVVRALKSGRVKAGEQSVRWDGRDRSGRNVEAGLYFARLETPGGRSHAKIVRVQ
jgi:hypothetical protein